MNRVAVSVTKAVSKCAAVLLAWAVVGGMVAGCAGTRIKRLSGVEFVTQANQIGQMNSFSWTCYVGSSHERAYLEFGSPAIIGKGARTTVYWTLLSELPDGLAAKLKAGKPPWQPWQPDNAGNTVLGPFSREMEAWIDYDRPIALTVTESGPMPKHEWGNLINSWSYGNKEQTLHAFSVCVFSGGSLFGSRRAEMEKNVINAESKRNHLPNPSPPDFSVTTMPDGRKVYFTGLGFGPGGACLAGFTTLPGGKYDLLITEFIDFEDDLPVAQKLKAPAKPRSSLQLIFPRVERFLLSQMESRNVVRRGLVGDIILGATTVRTSERIPATFVVTNTTSKTVSVPVPDIGTLAFYAVAAGARRDASGGDGLAALAGNPGRRDLWRDLAPGASLRFVFSYT